jgi:hypothetical protein
MNIEVLADADSVARAAEESHGLKTNQRTRRRDKHRRFLEKTFRQSMESFRWAWERFAPNE